MIELDIVELNTPLTDAKGLTANLSLDPALWNTLLEIIYREIGKMNVHDNLSDYFHGFKLDTSKNISEYAVFQGDAKNRVGKKCANRIFDYNDMCRMCGKDMLSHFQ